MIRIISKIILFIILLTGFVVCNIYFFNSALEFSKIYPFNRVLIGNTLSGSIDTAESSLKLKSKIIKIEGEDVTAGSVSDLLTKYKAKTEINVTLDMDGRKTVKIIIKTGFNNNYFLFLMFLMFFGSIHYLWGCVVYFIRPDEIRTRLFLFFSIALSFFYYYIIEQFTFGNYKLIFLLIVLIMGFLNILLGYNLTDQRMNRPVPAIILVFAVIIIISSFGIISSTSIYIPLFIYLMFCSLFTLIRLINGIIKNNYTFIKWRYAILIIILFIGNSIPVLNILFSAFSDLHLPICITSGLTLLLPVMAGSAFLRYNQYDFSGFKIFRLNDLKLLLYNMVVAALSAVLLYSLLTISDLSYHKILYTFAAVFFIIILYNSQYLLQRGLKNLGYENKDKYAFSAQKIAEISSSSETLEYKLKNIYNEISGLSGAISLRLIIFLDALNEYYAGLSGFMEALPKNSDLFSMINMDKGIILKYALIQNSAVEKKIYDFLEKRNIIFAIPIIESDEIKGAFLIGERNQRGFYSDADIHYFHTVGYQVFQLVNSDYLYKDYILKKQYEKELDNASYVQLRLFPKAALESNRGIEISYFYRPYLRVIGDYFDFFKVDKDRTAIIIGDVSGHGLSTAMVLSAVNSITHAMLQEEKSFEKTFIEINNYLNKSYRGIELITLFIGIFNRKTKVMKYINAGHGAPLLIKKHEKKIHQIEGRSKILGADPDADYIASSISLVKDDELILYTDGVMEIYNEITGSSLNEEKFINIISENIEKDINGKIIEIERNVKFYSEDIRDDITIIGVKVH